MKKRRAAQATKSDGLEANENPKHIRILILEDSADDADLIERLLLKNGLNTDILRVDNKKEFEKALKEFKPDIILSDHTLPQFNSMEALKIVKAKSPKIPFMLVTGTVSEEFAVMSLKAGAQDYILKRNLTRLPVAIESSLRSHDLREENIVIKRLNGEIEKKNKELVLLNNEKDRFLSIVSHDLHHYLSTMTVHIERLKNTIGSAPAGAGTGYLITENIKEPTAAYRSEASGKTRKISVPERNPGEELPVHISGLERNLLNMRTLLSDILTVNRIQSGIINPVYNLVNIGELLIEVVKRNEDTATRKNIELICDNSCKEHYVKTDASYFSIIVDNLISNAIKFSHSDKKIWITLAKKNNYSLKVKDEGQGIPLAEMPGLYKRFHKLSPKPTRNEPTNGLGLSIVKELVDNLNWTIECESRPGAGTTFTLTFE